ncbi:T9SS type B sorting domain-containing protein [uncultured Winogradskyella sp.]|uniref:T9SS type B sorting domain-containing protein n=1 Tax=uncultured Winogradskyella sp. TaxID=395353 RepID=UPI0030DC6C9A|tara:strand:+ start:249942 stop:255887 length:5946 start_codon:yes stop_codon:yes gene_type:complete
MNKYLVLLGFIVLGFQLNAQEPNDCVNAVTVCGNGSFLSNATGPGSDFEINSCGGFENNSLWLEVNIVQAGTLGFDLIPNDPDILVDYDFWVFGPNRLCSNLGAPIRCATTNPNEAGLPNNLTGINGSTTLTQTGPGANGNGYVFWLNVNVGESYFIVIDRPEGDGGFELQWTGTATAGAGAFPATPDATEIADVIQCSSTADIGIFDLNGLRNSINPDPINTIEFYENLADATDDINELPGIYANTSNPQTVYAKVKSSGTDCYTIVDFDLIVSPIPEAALSVSSNGICQGDTVTFTITGTPNATVNYNVGGGATQQIVFDATGIEDITLSPIVNTEFNLETVQVVAVDGTIICSQGLTDSETVTVTSTITPIIVNNSPICEGEDGELQFTGNPNATITYTVDSGVAQTFNLDATGNFSLTLLDLTTTTDIEIISVTGAVLPNCVLTLNNTETIVVNPSPTVIDPNPLLVCNDGINPNTASFDLNLLSGAISNNLPNVAVTYYETLLLAETGNLVDALVSPYNSTSADQTVYVRVETNLGCVDYTTLNLQVVAAPVANTAMPLQACDSNNLGFGIFDLTQSEGEIIAGNTQAVQVSYYILETEAQAGTPAIVNPTVFQNTILFNQTIYARVDSDATDCYSISALNLEVFNTPSISALSPLEVCDDISGDGIEQFNLETQTPLALNGATGVTITYHLSLPDAENRLNPLTSPYTSLGNSQTVYIRAENDFNTVCYTTASFNLIVTPLPLVVNPTPLQVCDDGTADGITDIDLNIKNLEITNGNLSYIVSYHLTQADADNNANTLLIPYTNNVSGQIVFVRIEDNLTGCFTTTTLELIVEQAPVANMPLPLEYCDPDSDNFGFFDLTSKDNEITGGDPSLSVTYHETIADADNNVNPIQSPYANIVQNIQTIYARVESSTIATDCDTIVELQIIVNETPQLGVDAPTPLELCDDITTDGFAQFNLTSKTTEILQNLADPTLYNVGFYENETDADIAINLIPNFNNYTNTNPFNQIIWVRVEDNLTGCYKLTTLELIVNQLPLLNQPNPLELCDYNNTGDEIEEFTLEDATSEILNGQSGIGLTYFETVLDANANVNAIFSPYENTSNPQTIFVKATNDFTGCETIITLTLRVNPIPSPIAPTDLEECDEDNDGFTSFNFEEKTIEITGGELNVAITYHETLEAANTGNFPLASPYTNIVMDQQTIYVRATNTITGCHNNLETLIIRVLEIPEVPLQIADYLICDTNSDGFAQFDLTTKSPEIINAQTNVNLTYHVTQADATLGDNPITNINSFTNSSNPQTIYVRLENDDNICFDIGFFDISVELPPQAIQPSPLELCDDESADEITVFDLTVKNNEITGGESSWSVSYYETEANAQAQTAAVNAEAYSNTSIGGLAANPQTLFAVVTDTDTGCTDMVTLTIRVLPNPTPTQVLPDLVLCDDNNVGDMVEEFNLTTNENLVFNGEANVSATYFETFEAAEEGVDAILDPTEYSNISSPQIIYIRVANNNTGCFTLVNFTLIVNALPDTIAITDFIACELNTDGIYSFDLSEKDDEVLNGQAAALYNVTYHTTQQDADDVINALVSPYINVSNPQQIFVAITNINTGCFVSIQTFNIEVQEAAEANSDTIPIVYEVCNDEVDTDNDTSNNTSVFNLFTQNDEVLDGQNPANYIVSYYASEFDAELAVNPLNNAYENMVNPQIIWARVDNNTLDVLGIDTSICYKVTELTLQVNLRPQFNLENSYTLCLNTNGTEALEPLVIDTGLLATNYNFEWSYNGTVIITETDSSIMPTQGGIYSVTVTDVTSSIVTNCTNTITTEVIESEPPVLEVNLLSQTFTDNNIIEALATGNGDYEYSLDNGPWQDDGIFINVSGGEHQITARDKKGCGFVTESIFVIYYPLYFTPNGDGNNDTWNIEGVVSNAKIYIFDRYGKLLKQLNPDGIGWDGTFNGNMMPTNDYWFTVQYNEPLTGFQKEFKAHFALKR